MSASTEPAGTAAEERTPAAQAAPRTRTRTDHPQWDPLARALLATGDPWTLPIVLALASGPRRLGDMRPRLPGISTGVLNRHLQAMVEEDLLLRQRFRELPPRVEYRLSTKGEALLPVVAALARWGMSHMWSGPATPEQIDVGAVLRLLPLLLDQLGLAEGAIEMAVELSDRVDRHLFDVVNGRLRSIEPAGGAVATSLRGSQPAWVATLGPRRDAGQLRISGDERLAAALVSALCSLT